MAEWRIPCVFNDYSPKHQVDWKDYCEPEIVRTEHSMLYYDMLCYAMPCQHLPRDEANKVEIFWLTLPDTEHCHSSSWNDKCFGHQFCLLLQVVTSPRNSETQTWSQAWSALSRSPFPHPQKRNWSSFRKTLVLKNGNDVHAQYMSKRNKHEN